jgi:fucose 4-O-acetylase-like acetyltransferase
VNDGPERSLAAKLPFILWEFHLQAFFMGLLFFLAGIFADGAIRRRGPGSFLRERLLRLGLPSLLYMVLIQPFIVYGLLAHSAVPGDPSRLALYVRYLTTTRVLRGNGPMWFALALLFFCAVLALWRAFFPSKTNNVSRPAPGVGRLLAFAAVLALATTVTRVRFPIETNFYNFQLCFFPQYIAAFVVGLAAAKGGWVQELVASRRARLAGWLGLIGGPLAFLLLIFLGGTSAEHGVKLYFGGWNLRALGLAVCEQFAGLGLALGMMAWFQRSFNQEDRVARWLSVRSFAVYVLHPPILVALTLWFRPIPIGPFLHVVLLTLTGLGLSFAVADVVKRVPGLRRIL